MSPLAVQVCPGRRQLELTRIGMGGGSAATCNASNCCSATAGQVAAASPISSSSELRSRMYSMPSRSSQPLLEEGSVGARLSCLSSSVSERCTFRSAAAAGWWRSQPPHDSNHRPAGSSKQFAILQHRQHNMLSSVMTKPATQQ
jgi:hypothetical protein